MQYSFQWTFNKKRPLQIMREKVFFSGDVRAKPRIGPPISLLKTQLVQYSIQSENDFRDRRLW